MVNSWKGAKYGEQGTRKRKRQGKEKEEEGKTEEVIERPQTGIRFGGVVFLVEEEIICVPDLLP
jgi:hypothetical protein